MIRGVSHSTPVNPVVVERARGGEPDRYLSALLAPPPVQGDLLCLAAFVADVAAIPGNVSEPLIGEMRLQWWRDVLARAEGDVKSGNPIADGLADAIVQHRLPVELLVRIVDARSHDLTGELHSDDKAVRRYFADCEGLPFALAAMIGGRPMWRDELVQSAGFAYGVARSLGQLPALIHNGGFPMPASALDESRIDPKTLSVTPHSDAVRLGIEEVASRYERLARVELRLVLSEICAMEAADRTAVLPLAMVEPYFAAQRKAGFNRLEMMAQVVPLRRVWRLALARYAGRF